MGALYFFCEQDVGVVELLDVVGPVVGGKGDAGEDDSGSAGFEFADDFIEVCAGIFNAENRGGPSLPPNSTMTMAGFHRDDAVDALKGRPW